MKEKEIDAGDDVMNKIGNVKLKSE